jgi:hypothetical protein
MFQDLYNGIKNPMSFDPWNCSLKICESIWIPTPKVGAHLGVCEFIPSHCPIFPRTWNVTLELHFQLIPLQSLALVVNPRLRSWHCHLSLLVQSLPCFHLNFRVHNLELLYLFTFQTVCIYHLNLMVQNLWSFHFRFKVYKLKSHIFLLSKKHLPFESTNLDFVKFSFEF